MYRAFIHKSGESMSQVLSIGTYLPPWTVRDRRVKGPDEDALTMAVAAGRAADPDATAQRVVLVSRDFPLLEGGNGAVLLAALSLPADTPVAEVLGGAVELRLYHIVHRSGPLCRIFLRSGMIPPSAGRGPCPAPRGGNRPWP